MMGLSGDCEALEKLSLHRDFTKDAASLPDFAAACRTLVHRVRTLGRVVDPLVAAALEKTDDKSLKKDLKTERERTDAAWAPALAEADASVYLTRHLEWLLHRFPKGRYVDVSGLCKVVTRAEIAAADWSLTPGRYVGVAPAEVDDEFDFEQTMRDLHTELADLDTEAAALAKKVQKNFAGLVV
jgi:type I restriction enzyme M protein